ncbi:hypothetical protein ACFL6U_27130 [Planctomycetota bacterium]
MPFLVRWPGKVKAGSLSNQTICFTDMMATFAAIMDVDLPTNAGPGTVLIFYPPCWACKRRIN